jgi:PAS domain S-box-containing protein
MAALVDSANLGIVSTSLDGTIVSWNGGAGAVLGYTGPQMVGTVFHRLLSGSSHAENAELLATLARGGDSGASLDVVLPHRDGHEVHLALTLSPIIDEQRRVIGHSMVFQDITARKQIEGSLARAKESAERTSREFEAFSYAVAHDLRAPLRAIDGFSQALLEDYPDALDEVGQGYLTQVCSAAKYMAQLIDSLLALARLTHGGVEIEPVDLSARAHESILRLRATDAQRRVDVVIAEGVLGRGDPAMLGLVLDNLLGNAWKYTRSREAARIEFGCYLEGGQMTYFVKDNGVGFDMAYSDKLFGVFQRLHAVEAFEGTGIGLATAKKVLQRHGGRIWAHGEVGVGATFFFTLHTPGDSCVEVPAQRSR